MKNFKKKLVTKKGFTLIELIVVITILAILGTIAFVSFLGYTASSRDARRISDIKSIRTSLELFGLNTGKFPDPNNPYSVTFSGSEIRSQGTFGEQTLRNVSNLNKLPVDPLTEQEYTYSVVYNKKEFELGAILETNNILSFNNIKQANALSKKKATAYIKGNYNGKILKVIIGNKTYVLAIPSIINGDFSISNIIDLINAKKLVYNGYSNLPASYTGTTFEVNGEDDLDLVNSSELIVFTGNIEDLIDPDDSSSRIELIQNLKEAYQGTDLENQEGIEEIINLELADLNNPTSIEESIAGILVNNNFGGNVYIEPIISTGDGGNQEPTLVCEDMTQENVDNLNNTFGESYTKEEYCTLTELDLSDYGLTTLPDEIGYLNNLEYLRLCCNNISELPTSIGNLTNLIELDLDENQILNLPDSFGNLTNLTSLYLGYNQISKLPDSFGNLTNLTSLSLDGNSGLGNLSNYFDKTSEKTTQTNITYSGEPVWIWGNNTNIAIQIGFSTYFDLEKTTIINSLSTYVTETCTTTYTSSNTSVATISGDIITTVGTGTTNITPIGGNCSNNTPILLTVIDNPYIVSYDCSESSWNTVDTNCDKCDVIIGSQTWAGCNSTLGVGYDYDDSLDYVNCYDYNGTYKTTGCNFLSTDKEITYFNANSTNIDPNSGVDNIWGKLYIWSPVTMGLTDLAGNVITEDNNTICPLGRHVPSDKEWENLETMLNLGTNLRNSTNGYLYDGMGWKYHDTKNANNNLIEALQIPLAGKRNYDGKSYVERGYTGILWSSTESFDWGGGTTYYKELNYNNSLSSRRDAYQTYGLSVRCIKD